MTTVRSTPERPAPVLRSAVLPSLVVGALCSVVALLVDGDEGFLGAAVGALCVVAFFGFGQLVLQVFRDIAPSLLLVIALMTYLLQVVALVAVYVAIQDNQAWQAAISTTALGVTAIVTTMVWMAGLVHAARRERIPLFETEGSH